jgi:hypothetical protein
MIWIKYLVWLAGLTVAVICTITAICMLKED